MKVSTRTDDPIPVLAAVLTGMRIIGDSVILIFRGKINTTLTSITVLFLFKSIAIDRVSFLLAQLCKL